ncbi:MAG: ribbon-helix-helix protein, CopG family [Spirochaeta sp.]|nr:ribbon-helix-helix protein, CopG family [Spirochaeta sp.]
MGSTTVHIPDEILGRIDEIARRRGTSRNRVVLASREAEITRDSGVWPGAFFNPPTDEELRILDEATREIEDVTANLAHFSRIAALTSRHWRGESA